MRFRALLMGVVVAACTLAAASDYKLILPESAKPASRAAGIFVYDQKGVLKQGDWVVEVVYGTVPKNAPACSVVWSDEKSVKPLLAPEGAAKGATGKIHLAKAAVPRNAVQGALVFVSGPVPSTTSNDLLAVAKRKAQGIQWGYVLLGVGAIVGLVALLTSMRRKRGPAPLVGRKLYEENIREVHSFMEKILVAQRKLVKNPPVIRSFRKDIDGFKDRLEALEASTRGIEQQEAKIIESLDSIEKVVRTISNVESRLSREIAGLGRTLDGNKSELDAKLDVVQAALPRLEKADEALHRELQSQSTKSSIELHALSESVKAGFVAEALATEAAREASDRLTSLLGEVKNTLPRLQEADERLSAELGKVAPAVDEKIAKVQDSLKPLVEAQEGLRAELASAAVDLAGKIEAAANALDPISQAQGALGQELATTAQQLSDRIQGMDSELKTRLETQLKELVARNESTAAALQALEGLVATAKDAQSSDSKDKSTLLVKLQDQVAGLAKQADAAQANALKLVEGLQKAVEGERAQLQTKLAHIESVGSKAHESAERSNLALQSVSESLGAKLDGLSATAAEDKERLSEVLAELHRAVEASQGDAAKNLNEILSKSSEEASRRLDELAKAVGDVREHAASLASELGAARKEQGSLTTELKKQTSQVDTAVAGLSKKLGTIESKAEGLADALTEQASRLKAFENLERSVSALQEDLRSLSALEGEKKEATATGVELTKKVASTQTLRLEQLSQEVRQIQDSVSRLDTLGSAMVAMEKQLGVMAEVSATPGAPSVPAEAFETLVEQVAQLGSALSDLKDLPAAVHQLSATPATSVHAESPDISKLVEQIQSMQSSLGPLSALGAKVEELRAQMDSTRVVASDSGAVDLGPLLAEMKSLAARVEGLGQQLNARESSESQAPVVADNSELLAELASVTSSLGQLDTISASIGQLKSDLAHESALTTERIDALATTFDGKLKDTERSMAELKAAAETSRADTKAQATESSSQPEKPQLTVISNDLPDDWDEEVKPTAGKAVSEPAPTAPASRKLDEENHVATKWDNLPGRAMPWLARGAGASRSNSIEATFALGEPIDTASHHAPSATPDPSAQVGSLLFTGRELVYTNGELLKGYWPGRNEREIEVGAPAEDRPNRLLIWEDQLFVTTADKVESYDLDDWSKGVTFSDSYLDQTSTMFHWVGVKQMNGMLAIEFRNSKGAKAGQLQITNASATGAFFTATAANSVYLASGDGRLFRATEHSVDAVGQFDGELRGIQSFGANLVAITSTKTGIKAHLHQVGDKPSKTIDLHSEDVLPGGAVVGDKCYFVDRSNGQLLVVDLAKFKIVETLPMEYASQVVSLAAMYHGNKTWLALASAPSKEASGMVRLLNPLSGVVREVAPLSHPNADLLFAQGYLVVASSSSYQNMVRLFDPFRVSETSVKKAA